MWRNTNGFESLLHCPSGTRGNNDIEGQKMSHRIICYYMWCMMFLSYLFLSWSQPSLAKIWVEQCKYRSNMIEQIKIQLWNQHSLLYWLTIYGAIIVNSEKWYVIVYCFVSSFNSKKVYVCSMLYDIHSHSITTRYYLAKWLLFNMIGLCPSDTVLFVSSVSTLPLMYNVSIISSMGEWAWDEHSSSTNILNP